MRFRWGGNVVVSWPTMDKCGPNPETWPSTTVQTFTSALNGAQSPFVRGFFVGGRGPVVDKACDGGEGRNEKRSRSLVRRAWCLVVCRQLRSQAAVERPRAASVEGGESEACGQRKIQGPASPSWAAAEGGQDARAAVRGCGLASPPFSSTPSIPHPLRMATVGRMRCAGSLGGRLKRPAEDQKARVFADDLQARRMWHEPDQSQRTMSHGPHGLCQHGQ